MINVDFFWPNNLGYPHGMSVKFGLWTFHKLETTEKFWLYWLLVALFITMKYWYRTSQSGQSTRTISDIASVCNVWFLSQNLLLSEEWRLRLEMMKTLDSPENFQIIFRTFFKQILKKRRCDASGDQCCNSFTNR